MNPLPRRQFFKLTIGSVLILGTIIANPFNLIGWMLSEPAHFYLPDKVGRAVVLKEGTAYMAVVAKPGGLLPVGAFVRTPFMVEKKDPAYLLILDGRKLYVGQWPELAEEVRNGLFQ